MMQPVTLRTRIGKRLTFALLALLVAQCILVYVNQHSTSALTLAFKIAPILPLLPAMLRNQARAYIWLCFILLLYFLIGVQHALDTQANIYDYTFVALVTLLFISAMMTARWIARSIHLSTEQPPC